MPGKDLIVALQVPQLLQRPAQLQTAGPGHVVAPAGAAAVLVILIFQRFLGERYALVTALSFGFVLSLEGGGALYKVGALAFSEITATRLLNT